MSTALGDLLDLTVTDRAPDSSAIGYRGSISAVFTIGPKVHGGSLQMMVAAAARRALSDLAEPDADPALLDGVSSLALASDYLAAPDPDEVDLAVRIVKRGRTVSLAHVEVTQRGRLMVSSTVTLGRLDTGEPHHRGATPVDDLPAEPVPGAVAIGDSPLGEVMHLAPALDLSLDPDWFPVLRGGTGEPAIRGWTRPRDAAAQPETMALDFPVLVCDISPPVVMNLGLFGWAPTVQLTTYLRRVPEPGWLRFAATSTEVGRGMFAEDHVVVDAAGALVAQSRQLALIPARR
ncbi:MULTISPECIES: thioesterase family protein [unclassified Gordonia (in: high G+C Gram-positive bacteria)]|uniref:thioesterase family protein n=1 Tax=unclassified Gordonia (in: high G+C Gram-positive bacteria) TaxID=2657482 RepID=UPI001FFEA781|nr:MULTISPECIES: thioesterase family protein [unclassified Gordonia (in: high G+C Gram-positive bacteria)]UQE74617.1 thioesterase family protein [Gordonia sp. PP30]